MTPLLKSSRIHLMLAAAGISSLVLTLGDGGGAVAWGQEVTPQPERARALLDQVKKSELDRQIAVKQTEIERLKEDQAKIERDSNGLQKTIESTSGLMTDGGERLGNLMSESRRLEHELAVAEARINAERLKIEGLKALTDAQGKSLSALARRAEEAAARSRLRTVELEMLQAGKQVPGEGREELTQTELTKARKILLTAAAKTEAEERLAHEAMKAAASKMTAAEASATTAQRLADNDLTLEAAAIAKAKPKKTVEKATTASSEKAATEKSAPAPAPVASGPKVMEGGAVSSKAGSAGSAAAAGPAIIPSAKKATAPASATGTSARTPR